MKKTVEFIFNEDDIRQIMLRHVLETDLISPSETDRARIVIFGSEDGNTTISVLVSG